MSHDTAFTADAARVGAQLAAGDSIRWRPSLRVDKYDAEATVWVTGRGWVRPQGAHFEQLRVKPYETIEVEGNLLTTAGLQRLMNLLIGAGGNALTNTTARIGVGNSSTVAAVGQTDLQAAAGSANRWFQIMDASYPAAVNGVVTLRSTFGSADGNFTWSELATDIGTATVTSGNTVAALMLNRFVQALGAKVSGATWTCTQTITIS